MQVFSLEAWHGLIVEVDIGFGEGMGKFHLLQKVSIRDNGIRLQILLYLRRSLIRKFLTNLLINLPNRLIPKPSPRIKTTLSHHLLIKRTPIKILNNGKGFLIIRIYFNRLMDDLLGELLPGEG